MDTSSKAVQVLVILALGKFLRSFGLFMLYDLLSEHSVISTAWGLTLFASLLFFLLQRPFSGTPALTPALLQRAILIGALGALTLVLFLFGMLLTGPLRAILLGDYSHTALVAVASIMISASSAPARKVRGAVLSCAALLVLMVWDGTPGSHVIEHAESDGSHTDYHTVRHNKYFAYFMVSDYAVGLAILLISGLLGAALQRLLKLFADDVDGFKRAKALVTLGAAVVLTPVMAMASWHRDDQSSVTDHMPTVFLCSLLVLSVDFYIERAVAAVLNVPTAVSTAMLASVAGAVALTLLRGDGGLPLAAIAACGLLYSGTRQLLLRPAAQGAPIGYAPNGLPLYNTAPEPTSTLATLRGVLRSILDGSDTKQIFMFLAINFTFMLVEFSYGVWSNSLGLISDAFHMFFDCSALMVGLYAAVMAKWKPTRMFSFGYSRVEILSGFANGVFLVVISLSVFLKAVSRLHAPPHIHSERLMLVSAGGLFVNFIGIFAFSHAHHASHGGGSCSHGHDDHGHDHGHSHGAVATGGKKKSLLQRLLSPVNANMQGVFLHVLADTLGSVGVLISSSLIHNFGWDIADPVCSLFISALIFASVIPLLRQSGRTLLLGVPVDKISPLTHAFTNIRALEGVVGFQEPRIWSHTPNLLHGSVHIIIGPSGNEQKILTQASALLKAAGIDAAAVQIETQAVAEKRALKASNDRLSLSSIYSSFGDDITAV